MKIAVAYQDGEIFQHFGKTKQFKIYDAESGMIKSTEIIESGNAEHSALLGMLKKKGISLLICGGIGGQAVTILNNLGLRLVSGVSGPADEAVASYLKGNLAENNEANCDHESGEEHHCLHNHGEDSQHC